MAGGYVLPANPALSVRREAERTDPDHAYTLPELLDLAHSANPRARAAWQDARVAAAAVDLVRGAYGPRVVASISNRSHLGKAISLPSGHFGPTCSPF